MIRHIFKIIWNERKSNIWILVEYTVVFCILWFCCDYLSYVVRCNMEPLGFDITDTYEINMSKKVVDENEEIDEYALTQTFLARVKQYPGVESISLSHSSVPYLGSTSLNSTTILPDSILKGVRVRDVSTGFFDVFRIKLEKGAVFNWENDAESKNVVISGNKRGVIEYKNKNDELVDMEPSNIKKLYDRYRNIEYQVVGVVNPTKDTHYYPYEAGVYYPLKHDAVNLERVQIVIRTSPSAGKDFATRFTKDMREQLNIGPYFLTSITSMQDRKKGLLQRSGVTNNLNSIYAITTFLMINIFLGLIGTFWYRVQSRRSEIGTRISMGATKKNVQNMLFGEALLLLFVASFIAVNICLNIAQTEFLDVIGLPKANREQLGVGIEQDFLNYIFSFIILAVVSLVSIWYPARQAVSVPPAEALSEE
ncbi:FtsX-like permease family protein [Parabacteroides sp. OttesenSCG-928-K15]|nr:FtsX-like permease family protein [Parabacteroides sp. OttesenSCG-928-K15]